MRNASRHQCKVKMSGNEKKSERKKRVSKKFLEVKFSYSTANLIFFGFFNNFTYFTDF